MLFSVVVPVYNAQEYLGECLASLDAQTWRDFEVVLVDDGSSDASGAICDDYASRSPGRARVLHVANGGPFRARVQGVAQARGEYVAFLDADDALHPHALARFAQVLADEPFDLVFCDFSHDRAFERAMACSHEFPLREDAYRGEAGVDALREAVCSGGFGNLCSKVVRRELCPTGPSSPDAPRCLFAEDLLYLLPLMDQVRSAAYVREPLYWYRRHAASTVGSYRDAMPADLALACPQLLDAGRRWGHASRAAAGAALQYANLLKILFATPMLAKLRHERFAAVAHGLRGLRGDLTGEACRLLRPDNRLLVMAAMNNNYTLCRAILRMVQTLKRLRPS